MAPFSFMSVGASLLAKSFGLFSTSLVRCTSVIPAIKSFSTNAGVPPKRPLNGYMRFVMHQRPVVLRQYPDVKSVEIFRRIAQQWRTLTPEQKRPFEVESVAAREQFKVEMQKYQAQLTPVQALALKEERRLKLAKRKAVRKKRELTSLGKPKRPRSAFNIYMSEHFEEARGVSMQAKMKFLIDDWGRIFVSQKQVYLQLAEDDKVRYKNEMKSWEEHMVEIGREDLIRRKAATGKKTAATSKKTAATKGGKKTKATVVKKATGTSAGGKTAVGSSPRKTVRNMKKA